ncbi:MAG: PIG-L deacetylase family protein [Candidatus Lokiarchaeia archaeon]
MRDLGGFWLARIQVFAAHPDDGVIGMGGTITKLIREGHEVQVVIFTRGDEGYDEVFYSIC